MASVNKIFLVGNVTRDIETRVTPNGTSVAEVGLAMNHTRRGADGERVEDTVFVDVTLWGRTAEVVAQYSGKGKALHVEGRLQEDQWTDKETGAVRRKLKVVAESVQLL